jgi:DNA-binding LacI/PurR family transcriptional regulator
MLQAVQELGLVVPNHLSLIGYGDAPWSGWYRDGLTTIALPVRDVALNCGSFLIRRIGDVQSGLSVPGTPFHSASQASLIVRNSCVRPAELAERPG